MVKMAEAMRRVGKAYNFTALIYALVALVIITGVAMRFRVLPGDETLDVKSQLTIALEMVYEDGSTRIIEPGKDGILSVLEPLSILDDTGKPLDSINYIVKVKTTYKGTFFAGSIRGDITYQVNDRTFDTQSFDYQADFGSGELVRVVSGGVTKYLLRDEGTIGSNTLRIVCAVTVEIIFEDGSSDTMVGQGGVVVSYEETSDTEITAISVTVTPNFLY